MKEYFDALVNRGHKNHASIPEPTIMNFLNQTLPKTTG